MTHKAVLHFGNQALIVPIENVPTLEDKLSFWFAYTETLGTFTYDHYDVAPKCKRRIRK